jgi:FkbM family methyltransferase
VKTDSVNQQEGDYRRFFLHELPINSVGCELGVWKGDFSEEILRIVNPRKLYLIDPWSYQPEFPSSWYGGSLAKNQTDMDNIYESVKRRFTNHKNVQIVRKKTEELTNEIPVNSLDWVYIDGNHQYEYVLRDIRTFFSLVKEGGIICGDDYDRGAEKPYPITKAVEMFLKEGTCQLLWVKDNQFYLQKQSLRFLLEAGRSQEYIEGHLDETISAIQSPLKNQYPNELLKKILEIGRNITLSQPGNWKAMWLIALVAGKLGEIDLVDKACKIVLSLNREFWFAREFPKHVRGYYSQLGQDEFIERYFSQRKPQSKIFVEVGAFDGVHYSNVRRLVEKYGWRGVSIEPVGKNYTRLCRSYLGYDVKCIRAAISNHPGTAEMNVSTYPHLPEWGSDVASLSTEDNARWTKTYGAQWEKETVEVKPLTDIFTENGLKDVDLLTIDAEGHDIEVLEGLDFSKYKPQLIVVEYGDKKKEITNLLSSKGYLVVCDNKQDLFMGCMVPVTGKADGVNPFDQGESLSGLISDIPDHLQHRDRIANTLQCRDCDYIPKVDNAGLVFKGNPSYQLMHNGIKIIHGAFHGEWMAELIKRLKGHHEPQEEKAFYEVLKAIPHNATMIELGSFWAYYSMWFNRSVTEANNYMIEPNPEKLLLGRQHFLLNNMKGNFANAFIGRQVDSTSVFTDWDGKKYNVPQVTIDQFIGENNIPFVHILHSDIQGAEYDMLLGCEKSIASGKIGYMFISTHGDCHEKCLDFLLKHHFSIITSHTMAESFSVDGLIVASSNKAAHLEHITVSKNNNHCSNDEIYVKLEEIADKINPHLFTINYLPKEGLVKTQKRHPVELINSHRFDVPAKIIFGRFCRLNLRSEWGKEVYLHHIQSLNNFHESDGFGKSGKEAFIDSYQALLSSVASEGFNSGRSIIPVGNDETIIDGSHRLAAGYVLEKDVCTAVFDRGTNSYDYEYFLKRGLNRKYTDAIAYEYCRIKKNTYIVSIFPSAEDKDVEIVNILKKHTDIIYRKDVQLEKNGPHLLIKQMYQKEPWLGDWSNTFKGAKYKADQCFQKTGPVRVFLVETDDLNGLRVCKEEIRRLFNISNHSVHINDSYEETLRLAQIYLNENSIHFLNHAQWNYFENFYHLLDEYRRLLDEHHADKECFCVDGSSVMAVYGIRQARDIDYFHYGYEDVRYKNESLIGSHNKEIRYHTKTLDDIIFNPENHFYYEGLKFVSLSVLTAMKSRRGEKKDILDVEMMMPYLESSDAAAIAGAPTKKPKIVGLVAARNEEHNIGQCLRLLSRFTDAIVYLDDCSTDGSVKVVQALAGQCGVERILTKEQWLRDEPGDRNSMLQAGREIGGTHFIVLDADEIFTSNFLFQNTLRQRILSLKPGDQLWLNWICLWRSVTQYRQDKSVWTNNYKPFVFCDDGRCAYTSEFIHTPRVPQNLTGSRIQIKGYEYGVLHFQFVNWRNLLLKQAWYRCLERIREPQKSVIEINKRYAPSKDETNIHLAPSSPQWFRHYSDFDAAVFDEPDTWRAKQIYGWFKEYGIDYFKDLDIWDAVTPQDEVCNLPAGTLFPAAASSYLVSAIVSTYNSEAFIRGCLQDLVEQSLYHKGLLEIVVVNSGSQQNEERIVREYQSKYLHIQYIKTSQRETVYAAWNRGIKASHGKYITNANTDDRHSPEMLEKLAGALEQNPSIAAVYSHFHLTPIPNQTWQNKTPEKIIKYQPLHSHEQLLHNYVMGPQPMWRRSLHEEYGWFDESLKVAGDYEFFLRISQTHSFQLIPEPLGLYYYNSNSLQRSAGTRDEEDDWAKQLYKDSIGRIIRRPFAPSQDEGFKTRSQKENLLVESLRIFQKAQEAFALSDIPDAQHLIIQYQSQIDYSRLPFIDRREKQTNPLFSVIIVTCRRTDDLIQLLDCLTRQTFRDFETIVVDNSCTETYSIADKADCYVFCPINFMPAEGRNIGASFARGQIAVFIDDDALVGEDYLASIQEAFDSYDVLGLCGKVLPKTSNEHNYPDRGNLPFSTLCSQEGNSAFLISAWHKVSGQNPLLFGHEGMDFSWRLNQAFNRENIVMYWPKAVIYHDKPLSRIEAEKKRYLKIEAYLKEKHNCHIFAHLRRIEKLSLERKSRAKNAVPSHYNQQYFEWQKSIGQFGGIANLFKFRDYIEPDDTVLDFGCGGGYLLKNINCHRKIGVEINPAARREAQSQGIEVYESAQQIENHIADVIISNHALEHVLSPFEILQTLYTKLKPGGRIVLVVPHQDTREEFNPKDTNKHLFTWNQLTLGNLFERCGFQIEKAETIQHQWPPKYEDIYKQYGEQEFHRICREYAQKNNSYQIRMVAAKPCPVPAAADHVPVVLITYNRPSHTAQVLQSLKEHNVQCLYIFSDAAKTPEDEQGVCETRALIEAVDWTRPQVIYQKQNQGLAKSIVAAVNHVFEKYDRLILLEDDCVPQKYFFDYMYDCLQKYENDPKVFGISGYSVKVPESLLSDYSFDVYFSPRIGSWGWATWKRAWAHYEPDLRKLIQTANAGLIDLTQGGPDIPVNIENWLSNKLRDVWTLNWVLSVYNNNGCYLYPTQSHIKNIGTDGTGVHCNKTDKYNSPCAGARPSRYPDKPFYHDHLIENFRQYFQVSAKAAQKAIHYLNGLDFSADYQNPDASAQIVCKAESRAAELSQHQIHKPLQVLQVCTFDNKGGAAKIAWALKQAMTGQGYQHRMFVKNKLTTDPDVREIWDAVVDDTDICGKQGFLDYDIRSTFQLYQKPEFQNADIVHFHNLHGGYFNPLALPELTRRKSCIWTLHDMQSLTGHCAHAFDCEKWKTGCGNCPRLDIYPAIRQDRTAKMWTDKKQAYADSDIHLVVPSRWLMNQVTQSILQDKPIDLIYNGVNMDVFRPYPKAEVRKQFGLDPTKTVLAFTAQSGINNCWRDGKVLADAVAYLSRKYGSIIFLNIGNKSNKFDTPNTVNIPHIFDEKTLAMVYSASDVFLFPSLADNCPLSVLEAMACGLPVVSYKTGGIPELVEHGKNGILCEYKNAAQFIAAAEAIVMNQNAREQYGHMARQRVRKMFSLDRMIEAYQVLYERRLEQYQRDRYTQPHNKIFLKGNGTVQEKKSAILLATSLAPRDIENQQRAVQSWVQAGFDVISVNHPDEIQKLAPHFGQVRFVPVSRNGRELYGKPLVYIDDILLALKASGNEIVGIINSDIHLRTNESLQGEIQQEAAGSLVYARRVNVNYLGDPLGEPEKKGIDLFVMDRAILEKIPSSQFCLGVSWWDCYFPVICVMYGIPLKCPDVQFAFHIKHTLNWDRRQWVQNAEHFFDRLYHVSLQKPHILSGMENQWRIFWEFYHNLQRGFVSQEGQKQTYLGSKWVHKIINEGTKLVHCDTVPVSVDVNTGNRSLQSVSNCQLKDTACSCEDIQHPFETLEGKESIPLAQQDKSLDEALLFFRKAQEEFAAGNMVSARCLMVQYQGVVNYDWLFRMDRRQGQTSPQVSVIIVTYQRSSDLVKLLDCLGHQAFRDFETIVVDNGGTDISAVAGKADCVIPCPINFNPSEGRNIGAHFARGQIAVFLDDDALVKSDYLASILNAFETCDILGLRGRTLPKTLSGNALIYDLGDRPFPAYCSQEGNSAFLLWAWRAVGGQDPLLFGGEGDEFTWRLICAFGRNNAIIYWPDAMIYHDYGDASRVREKKIRYRNVRNYLQYKHNCNILALRKKIETLAITPGNSLSGQRPKVVGNAVRWRSLCYSEDISKAAAVSSPKVSVVMSCFNAAEYLTECLDSIAAQTLTDWEAIIVDDGSTDDTHRILKEYAAKDSRFSIYLNADNCGPYIRRNFAIKQTRAPFIAIHDADDIMAPQRLEILLNEILKDDRLAIVGSFFGWFMGPFRGIEYCDVVPISITHEEIMNTFSKTRYICCHAAAIIRKTFFDCIGLYDEQPWGADTFWLAKAGLYSALTGQVRFKNIPDCLSFIRKHGNSQTGRINPNDPRSRRLYLGWYYLDKLQRIVERKTQTPDLDVGQELRQCTCRDFIPQFGHLFAQWESVPVTVDMIKSKLNCAIEDFTNRSYVKAAMFCDTLCQMSPNMDKMFRGFNLLRGLSHFACGQDTTARDFLQREYADHKTVQALHFLQQVMDHQNASPTGRQRREIVDRFVFAYPEIAEPYVEVVYDNRRDKTPQVSVIMDCRHQTIDFEILLKTWAAQREAQLELILTTCGNKQSDFAGMGTLSASLVVLNVDEPVSTAAAKNIAVSHSRGRILVFVSPRVTVDENLICRLANEMNSRSVSAIRGRITGSQVAPFCPEYDLGDQPLYCSTDTDMLCAIRKDILDKIGPFDTAVFDNDLLYLSAKIYGDDSSCSEPVLYDPQVQAAIQDNTATSNYLLHMLGREQLFWRLSAPLWYTTFLSFTESEYGPSGGSFIVRDIQFSFRRRFPVVALEWVRRVYRRNPQSASLGYLLADMEWEAGIHEQAAKGYERFLQSPAAEPIARQIMDNKSRQNHSILIDYYLQSCLKLIEFQVRQGRIDVARKITEHVMSNKNLTLSTQVAGRIRNLLQSSQTLYSAGMPGSPRDAGQPKCIAAKEVQQSDFVTII